MVLSYRTPRHADSKNLFDDRRGCRARGARYNALPGAEAPADRQPEDVERPAMARRTRTLREMRQEYEAAEALGLIKDEKAARKPSEARERRPAKQAGPARMKVVWNVCDIGGRTVATFDYPEKAKAEELAAQLKARGKGNHFIRSEKVPMG